MNKALITIAVAIILNGCATVPKAAESWEQCKERAIKEQQDWCDTNGWKVGCFGAAGRGVFDVVTRECGYLPEPKDVLPEHKERLTKGCKEVGWGGLSGVDGRWDIGGYYPPSYETKLEKWCNSLEVSKPVVTPKPAAKKPFRVTSFRNVSGGMHEVIIATDRNRRVRCAGLDSTGEYAAVNTFTVVAPVDSGLLFGDGLVSVRCWEE